MGCLVLVVALVAATPDPATDYRRRWDDVAVGGWGRLQHVDVRVTSVRLARAVAEEHGDPLVSEATFVVVDVEARVTRAEVRFSDLTLLTPDGRRYDPVEDTSSSALTLTQPGFTRLGTEVFEVPDDRVPGSVLQVEPDGAAFDVYATAVRVDLGLDRGTALLPGPLALSGTTVAVSR